jgi:hypothetical protein
MNTQLQNRTTFSRPRDKSVEAYKAWIMEIAQRLTTAKELIQFTEKEWLTSWKEYWQENPVRRFNQPDSGKSHVKLNRNVKHKSHKMKA